MPYYRHPSDWAPERLDALLELPTHPDTAVPCGRHCCTSLYRAAEERYNDVLSRAAIAAAFDTSAAARAGCGPAEKVSFVPSNAERQAWRERENSRFRAGEYLPVPWDEFFEPRYPHLSVKTPGLVAFTKSEEHGYLDRQTAIKPGRYLKEFFPDWSNERIREYASQVQATDLELKIAYTAEDIVRVYIGGPSSCMSHAHGGGVCKHKDHHNDGVGCNVYRSSVHPVVVYGDSDLAVAYYGNIDRASGRCIVWPEKKIFSRLYGGEATLRLLLEQAGYHAGSVRGAFVRAIMDDNAGEYVMPYVDGIGCADTVTRNGHTWIRLGEGSLDTDQVNGLGGSGEAEQEAPEDDYANDAHADDWQCDHCRHWFTEDTDDYARNDRQYCESCYDALFAQCQYCQETQLRGAMRLNYDADYICSDCIEDETDTCAVDGCSNTFCEPLLSREANPRICEDHDSDYQWCSACDRAVPRPLDINNDPIDYVLETLAENNDATYQTLCSCGTAVRCADNFNLPFDEDPHVSLNAA